MAICKCDGSLRYHEKADKGLMEVDEGEEAKEMRGMSPAGIGAVACRNVHRTRRNA